MPREKVWPRYGERSEEVREYYYEINKNKM
jgi:hypothetical protein